MTTQSPTGTPHTPNSPIARLNDYGQSPWYDNISRSLLENGDLARMVDEGHRPLLEAEAVDQVVVDVGEHVDDGGSDRDDVEGGSGGFVHESPDATPPATPRSLPYACRGRR